MLRWHSFLFAALVGLTGVSLTMCKQDSDMNFDMAMTGMDGNIAAVLRVANQGEIDTGELAQMQAQDTAVKAFAQRMASEHGAAQQRQSALYTRLGITPADNATSRRLQTEARTALDMLRMETGARFDVAYLESQITMHMRVLGLIDSELLPAVRSSELRAELQRMRSEIVMHLQEAQRLRGMLGGGGDGGMGDGGMGDGGMGDGGMGDGGMGDGGMGDGGMGDGGMGDGGTGDGGMGDGGTGDGGITDGGADGGTSDGGDGGRI
jgi:predicted outer membrane protein